MARAERPTSPVSPILYGDGAVLRIPALFHERGWRRVLLVCGHRSFEASGAVRMLPDLEAVADVKRWSDFQPNTDAGDLARGLDVMRDAEPEAVLAVGGGSALDMAKLLCAYDGQSGLDGVVASVRSGERVLARQRGLVVVPTTSGTGSEVTHFAVVYVGDDKFSIVGPAMYPDAVVLDPALSLSGSAHQRATSGIDAVAQAIESLWATAATVESRRFARHALSLLLPCIEPFVKDPTPQAARAMSIGSHLAGRAIDISRTTAAHALSYAITKHYGVSHGHAVALTLGLFVEVHAQARPEDLQDGVDDRAHRDVMSLVLDRLGAATPRDGRDAVARLMEAIGLPSHLADAGIRSSSERAALADVVNAERLGNNPVRFSVAALRALLDTA